ncbi:MAG: fluoride exporter [Frankiaceae bacterium]|nr:fluoride exporter [Frankiaceae bacterium]
MILALTVGLAASVGAACRYLLDQVVQHQHDQTFPWGTFIINVTGSLLLGFVTALAEHHGLPKTATTIIGVGFAGGYTTWSTYMWESLALAEMGAWSEAAANIVASLAVGFAAAAAGFGLGQL